MRDIQEKRKLLREKELLQKQEEQNLKISQNSPLIDTPKQQHNLKLESQLNQGGTHQFQQQQQQQEQHQQQQQQSNNFDENKNKNYNLENTNPSKSSPIAATKASRRASASLLSKIKQRQKQQTQGYNGIGNNGYGGRINSAQSAAQNFGRFKRQFLIARSYFHEYPDSNRFEGDESWRPPEVFPISPVVLRHSFDDTSVLLNNHLSMNSENSILNEESHATSSSSQNGLDHEYNNPKGYSSKQQQYQYQQYQQQYQNMKLKADSNSQNLVKRSIIIGDGEEVKEKEEEKTINIQKQSSSSPDLDSSIAQRYNQKYVYPPHNPESLSSSSSSSQESIDNNNNNNEETVINQQTKEQQQTYENNKNKESGGFNSGFGSASSSSSSSNSAANIHQRISEANKKIMTHDQQREIQQHLRNSKVTRSQHLQQYLSNDFGEGTERIFLLMKTGYSVQWERLPVHFFSTFTRFPNFAIYSDSASSMAGYEIIDILQDLPMPVLQNNQLGLYVEQQKARQDHTYSKIERPKDERPWIMDKFKNIPMLQHAWKHAPDNDWYIIMDDDSYLFSDNVGRWLNTLDPNKPYYLGSAVAGLQHIFAHGGSGIVLSRGLMEMAFGDEEHSDEWVDEYSERALKECCGDYILAAFLKEKLNIGLNLAVSGKRFQGEDFTHVSFNKQNWCSDIISFHHSNPRNMELLWEYERIRAYSTRARNSYVFSPQDALLVAKANPTITYGDVYTDFVKPYLLPMRSMWDNGAKEFEFSWSRDVVQGKATVEDYLRNDGYSDKPYTSVDKCRQACLSRADCVMFRYDPYQKYCGYSSFVAFGQPKNKYQDNDVRKLLKQHGIVQPLRNKDESMHSEWRFDRIEAMRAKLTCDPPPETDASEYDDGREGWYWRAREKSTYSLLEEMKQ